MRSEEGASESPAGQVRSTGRAGRPKPQQPTREGQSGAHRRPAEPENASRKPDRNSPAARPLHPQQPSGGAEDQGEREDLPRAEDGRECASLELAGSESVPPVARICVGFPEESRGKSSLTWEPWAGCIVPAWKANVADLGGIGRKLVAILELNARGRARVTARAEDFGEVEAVIGSEETRGVSDAQRAQEWAEIALAGLCGDVVGIGPPGEHRRTLTSMSNEFSGGRPEGHRAGRTAMRPGEGCGPVGARPRADERGRTADAPASSPAPAGVDAGLVNHCIVSGDMPKREPKPPADNVNYTLHILYEVIGIRLRERFLTPCEYLVDENAEGSKRASLDPLDLR